MPFSLLTTCDRGPGEVAEVVRLAGFLPLVISLLARLFARHQSWTLADLVLGVLWCPQLLIDKVRPGPAVCQSGRR